ncbi:MAG TPA: PKD domain-containing protein [Phycisphaerae bacterium]|nr:PKD domain-containing protein [Phycisphaerae bacterium]HRY70741.1 PKD domain-containing protein [Phycisphaerae bacterium]HSA28775.1 PKD domain-containing protein [Phycisphaerae bacterium]
MKCRVQYGFFAVGAVLIVGLAAGICGCVPPQNTPPTNNSPTANAGPDQNVLPSAAVTLTGAASADPDGDALTYAWTQVLGTIVTLTGATTASPTFTAPASNATLVFQLVVNDGQGGTSTDLVTVLVVAGGGTSPVTPTLFVTSAAGPNVVGFAYPWTVSGNAVPNTVLTGASTKLVLPWAAVAISDGTLLVSNIDGTDDDSPSITGYVNAASATGNLAPRLEVTGVATSLVSPRSMAYHAASDTLLVADVGVPSILVYAGVSEAAFNGNVPPTRIITSGDLSGPQGIYLASNGDLYVANNGNNSVAVFANAHAANGTVAATRLITSTDLATAGSLQAVCVDQGDHLFAADSSGKVFMFNSASTLTGAVTPAATIQVQTAIATSLTAIAVDSGGHGYVLDGGANSAVYVFDSIATRSGTLPPDRTIAGNATQLVLPQRLFFWE